MCRLFAAIVLVVAAAGCHPLELAPPASPKPSSTHAPARSLRVGVARAEVTPPPGVSLFGHGPEGRVSDGYWSRLYCRVFAFLPDDRTPLVLSVCDLGAMGTLLQRSVVAKLAAMNDPRLNLPASRLMLTATHTHAGPAHYLEGDFYGGLMSSRAPGFDPNMVEFLASRIAAAVARAVRDARPARLSWAHTSTWGFTRNRSLVPFNQNHGEYAPDAACDAGPPPAGLLADERAIDPCLDVLSVAEVDAQGAAVGPIGSVSFFAMHPTVLPNTNRLIGADVDGVVSRAVEREMRRDWLGRAPAQPGPRDPVHAMVNTNEGDVSPKWSSGSVDEAIDIGERLGARIWRAQQTAEETAPIIDARYTMLHLPGARLFWTKASLCKVAELGVAAPKGASDHPTALTFVGDFRDENLAEGTEDACSAPKRPFLDFVQRLASGAGSFPEDVPLAVGQIGDTLISFVPAEMTVVAGNRLARAVAAEAAAHGLGARRSLVAGLANGYVQYVTTEEEYRLQHYEGASDLYGISTAPLLAERCALLTRAMAGVDVSAWLPDVDRVGGYRYTVAAERSRLPTRDGKPSIGEIEGRKIDGLCRLPGADLSLCLSWKDAAPGVVPPVDGSPWITLIDEALGAPAHDESDPLGVVDDRGLDFQTRVHDRSGNGYTWTTVFSPRAAALRAIGTHRVHVRIGSGSTQLRSPVFTVADPPRTCDEREVVACGVGR